MINKLKKELDDNPSTYGALSDVEVATLLNVVDKTRDIDAPIADIQSYLAKQGVYDKLVKKGRGTGSAPSDLASISMINIFESKLEGAETNHPAFQLGLSFLVSNNDITQAQSNFITAMGIENISRAVELGLPIINTGDVSHARSL